MNKAKEYVQIVSKSNALIQKLSQIDALLQSSRAGATVTTRTVTQTLSLLFHSGEGIVTTAIVVVVVVLHVREYHPFFVVILA